MKQWKIYLILSFVLALMTSSSSMLAQCIPDKEITLANGETELDICSSRKIEMHPGVNAGHYVFAVTDEEGTIEAIQTKNIIDLSQLLPGSKRVYGVSWFGVLHNPVGESINAAVFADYCYDLSPNFVSLNLAGGAPGNLEAISGSECLNNGVANLSAEHSGFSIGTGYEMIYVLTQGDDLVIQQVNASPEFEVTESGNYIIHSLIYDPSSLDLGIVEAGVTTGFDVNALLTQGGGDICALLDVAGAKFLVVNPDAGSLSPSYEQKCSLEQGVELHATVDNPPNTPDGFELLYVLTAGEQLIIQQVSATPSFTVQDTGNYTIHGLVYDPVTLDLGIVEFGQTTGFDVNGLLLQGGGAICASLDVAGAKFNVQIPSAGTLVADNYENKCSSGVARLSASIGDQSVIPDGFTSIYVLTRGSDLVIENVSDNPSFEVEENGSYIIHNLVYDPTSLDLSIVEPGVTTGFDVNGLLVQGGGSICGSLLVDGAKFTVASPSAGTLTTESNLICADNDAVLLEAQADEAAVIPDGYQSVYVLTSGSDLVIEDASGTPSFTVEDNGDYTIHTLVYDPETLDLGIIEFGVTTGVDVNSLLVQGGGAICASLDVTGVPFEVTILRVSKLSGGAEIYCMDNNAATLVASIEEEPIMGEGYESIYVLTKGPELVIIAVNEMPSFDVTSTGIYTIHNLVYDPSTLDLGIVNFGETTGVDVNGLLVQGGGDICAALDVAGARYTVGPDAGTLTSGSAGCLSGGEATLIANPNGDAVVTEGFETIYVLTSGEGLVIENVSAEPEFTVEMEGIYTIHTLIYDPGTLDLGIVELGVTTGVDVNGLLIQGGGTICASLDVTGAKFNVTNPISGTLEPVQETSCFNGEPVMIEATSNGDMVVPDGFSSIFVLTSGEDLVIQNVAEVPSFTVDKAGHYTVHGLVYDPSTLDLGIVEIGTTTGFDVNALLSQGGGAICASLDVAGAKFVIGPNAGTMTTENSFVCPASTGSTISAQVNEEPVIPDGYIQLFVLTSGDGLIIEDVSENPTFEVTGSGVFTIHSLVYDASTLDLGIVEFGVTSGVDVNGLLVQGGGAICASLDVQGAMFTVGPGAGSLKNAEDFVCFSGAETAITAEIDSEPFIPEGYSQLFVLTSGEELVIEQVGAEPSFNVSNGGNYTIHSLVYDATTLDLSIVEFGTTTGVDVNSLLVQGGGEVCASLDVAGASFTVGPDAGTLIPGKSNGCVGSFTIDAKIEEHPVVPEGYSTLFVLTKGQDLIIEAVSADPSFEVTELGTYTIHTLVYDPNTLDLSIVEFGVTTGVDVNGLLVQGGGSICAALDVAGASIEAAGPSAGTLMTAAPSVCFEGAGTMISAESNGDLVMPGGYSVIYVLTRGASLVIEQVAAEPAFSVESAGQYTIHTLVYDPETLDLGIVEFGVTTGVDVN